MRKFFFLLLFFFVNGHELLYAQELRMGDALYEEMNSGTFLPLFEALKDGNVEVIKCYLAGDMYRQTRVLLEENKGYPQFLKKFYKGANFSVESAIMAEDAIIANIVIEFPYGGKSLAKLRLNKDADQQWKVVDEVGP